MKWLAEIKHPFGVLVSIRLQGDNLESAKALFLRKHPHLIILSVQEIPDQVEPTKPKIYTSKQRRLSYRNRIKQMRSTLQAISEDEYNLLASGERVQICRLICKVNHLLGGWHANTIDLRREGLL